MACCRAGDLAVPGERLPQLTGQSFGANISDPRFLAKELEEMSHRALTVDHAMIAFADLLERNRSASCQHACHHFVGSIDIPAKQLEPHRLSQIAVKRPFGTKTLGRRHGLPGRLNEGKVIVAVQCDMHFLPLEKMHRRDQPVRVAMAFALEQVDADQQIKLAQCFGKMATASSGGNRIAAAEDEGADFPLTWGQYLIRQFGKAMLADDGLDAPYPAPPLWLAGALGHRQINRPVWRETPSRAVYPVRQDIER